MLVVMTDGDRKDLFELPSIHDQDPVETLATYSADPPFADRIRAGCPYGRVDRPDAFGAEHLIEPSCELAVAIVEQKPDRLRTFDERLDDVPCLLVAHSPVGLGVIPARYTCRVAISMNTSTYSRRNSTVSTLKKSQATIPSAWARGNARHVYDHQRGAGSIPACCKIDQTVLAAIPRPSPANSP